MEDALELADYLPMSLKNEEETNYIASLWRAFTNSYENEDYQFALLPYHMLFMSFVYFTLWKIRSYNSDDVHNVSIGFGKDNETTIRDMESPFKFSVINERSIFRFLKLIRCEDHNIGQYAKLVDIRNDATHANGQIYSKSVDTLNKHIRDILRSVKQIQSHNREYVERVYYQFLQDAVYLDEREFLDDEDQIREVLVHGNYLSQADIKMCMSFNILKLAYEVKFEERRALHEVLIEMYGGEG